MKRNVYNRQSFTIGGVLVDHTRGTGVSRVHRTGFLLIALATFTCFWLWVWNGEIQNPSKQRVIRPASDAWLLPKGEVLINPHPFPFLINEKDACGSATITLLIFVASSPAHADRRQAIRQSWAQTDQQAQTRSKVLFLLGKPGDVSIQDAVKNESKQFKDLLQEDFIDSYNNLTLKTVMGLRWAALHCPRAQHVMKTDDDVFVNLPHVVEFVQNEGRPRWIAGCVMQKKSPMPISPTGVSMPPGHPPFVAGAGYVISGDLVVPLFRASLRTRLLPIEDVFVTAYCARSLGVHPEHNERFSCGEMINNDCYMTRLFTRHHVHPQKQRQLWNLLNDPLEPCASQTATWIHVEEKLKQLQLLFLNRSCVRFFCSWYTLPIVVFVASVHWCLYLFVITNPTFKFKQVQQNITTKDVSGILRMDLAKRVVDPHRYPYMINEINLCATSPEEVLLFVAVCSAVDHLNMRNAIRQTWGRVAKERPDVQLAFMLGKPVNESLQAMIEEESKMYSDIIQEDFLDTYYNLSLKSVMLLKWTAKFCPGVRFLLKTDDDMLINMPSFLNYLNARRSDRWQLFGRLYHMAKPNRSRASKRFPLLASFRSRYYPTYLAGGAYAMTGDVVPVLYAAAVHTPIFRVEDVFITGLCANMAHVPRFDHGNFQMRKNSSVCDYRNILTAHGFTPQELQRVWKGLLHDC